MRKRCSIQQGEKNNFWSEESPENWSYLLFRFWGATRYKCPFYYFIELSLVLDVSIVSPCMLASNVWHHWILVLLKIKLELYINRLYINFINVGVVYDNFVFYLFFCLFCLLQSRRFLQIYMCVCTFCKGTWVCKCLDAVRWRRKTSTVGTSMTSWGRLFHCRTVRGKKDWLCCSVLGSGIRYPYGCAVRVGLVMGWR